MFPAASRFSSQAAHWLRKVTDHPGRLSIFVCALVFTFVFALWRGGMFQFFELQLYDRLLKARHLQSEAASKVVIIGITEEDIQHNEAYPIPDDTLLTALQKLADAQPAAVVVDIYRDLPVPGQDPKATDRLAQFWTAREDILAIERLGLNEQPSVRRPRFLREPKYDHLVGFNDFPVDYTVDDTARRALLVMDDGNSPYFSIAFKAAELCLRQFGIEIDQPTIQPNSFTLGRNRFVAFESNDGPYIGADARGFQILLDFRGPDNFPIYSFTDLLSGKVPPESLRGNVVLIGLLASSMKDHLITPLAKRFPGVQLHAHATDQIIRQAMNGQRSIQFWSEWQESLWLLLWCAFGTWLGLRVKSPIAFVLTMMIGAGALAGAYWFAFGMDFWLPVVTPAASFASAAVLATSSQVYAEKRERDVLMQLFSRHVAPEIATDIWQHRDQFMDGHVPKAQDIEATVMFTDLKGFSSTAEKLAPVALLAWLNEYMEVMSTEVGRHGGMVNKYMGDAIMAIFGAPIPRTKESEVCADAVNAVDCALAMSRELDRLNALWVERGLPASAMRVGIATGVLVSGSIGGVKRLEYTVTGDTVVIAKRLESVKKNSEQFEKASLSSRVLIAESTRDMLGSQFKVKAVGALQLEGRHASVNAFVVTGREGETS